VAAHKGGGAFMEAITGAWSLHSPSPGYSAACCREEWRGDRAV